MSFRKLPVVFIPVSVLRHAVIVVALPDWEAGAVRWPVRTKPPSVAGQVPTVDPVGACFDAVFAAVYVVVPIVHVVVGTALNNFPPPARNSLTES
jgi:hypothetical protein